MFWNTEYTPSPHIDELLMKEDVTLEELLNDDEILQEYKSQNKKLISYFHRAEIIDELVKYVTTEPPTDVVEALRFKHSNVACEILTADTPSLSEILIDHENILQRLYSFLKQDPPLNPLLTSFFSKTFGMLFTKKNEQDWFSYQCVCLQVLEFIKIQDGFLDNIFKHTGTPAIIDLLLEIIKTVEGSDLKNNLFGWLQEQKFIGRLINLLSVSEESDKHNNIAGFVIDIITHLRSIRHTELEERHRVDDISITMLQELEDPKTMTLLLDIILSNTQIESCVVAGIKIIMKLLQPLMSDDPTNPVFKAESEYRNKLLNSLLPIIATRINDFHSLLLNPPPKPDIQNTVELLSPPFGNTRLKICTLFALLLESKNLALSQAICETDFFNTLIKLFRQYCWNNLLHSQVVKCICAILDLESLTDRSLEGDVDAGTTDDTPIECPKSALQTHIIVNCRIISKLVDCWTHNTTTFKLSGRRLGYMGHLIIILNHISICRESKGLNELIELSLSDDCDRETYQFVMGEVELELEKQNRFLANIDPFAKVENDSFNDYTTFNVHSKDDEKLFEEAGMKSDKSEPNWMTQLIYQTNNFIDFADFDSNFDITEMDVSSSGQSNFFDNSDNLTAQNSDHHEMDAVFKDLDNDDNEDFDNFFSSLPPTIPQTISIPSNMNNIFEAPVDYSTDLNVVNSSSIEAKGVDKELDTLLAENDFQTPITDLTNHNVDQLIKVPSKEQIISSDKTDNSKLTNSLSSEGDVMKTATSESPAKIVTDEEW